MDRFVARENIRHFRDLLWSELTSAERSRVQKLLVEEEDKFGRDQELLFLIEGHIANGNRVISQQQARVASLRQRGDKDVDRAQTLLDSMTESQRLLVRYHEQVVTHVRRNHLP
jgi:hypothetical protein